MDYHYAIIKLFITISVFLSQFLTEEYLNLFKMSLRRVINVGNLVLEIFLDVLQVHSSFCKENGTFLPFFLMDYTTNQIIAGE